MRTVDFLPEEIRNFISLATDAFEKHGNSSLGGILTHFAELSSVATKLTSSILASELGSLLADPNANAKGWDVNQLLLEVNRHYSLGISILYISPSHLLNSVGNSAYIVLGEEPFKCTIYKMPNGINFDVFKEDAVPILFTRKIIAPGEMLRLTAGEDIVD